MITKSQIDDIREMILLKQQERNNIDKLFEHPDFDNLTLRDYCVVAKHMLSGSSFGSKLEHILKQKFQLMNKHNETSGDAVSAKVGNIEIKVSLGDKNNGYCLAQQVRPFHNIDYYLCMYYNVIDDEVTLHLVPSDDMVTICREYGGYSHGTKNRSNNNDIELGIFGNKFKKHNTKSYQTWKKIERYQQTENKLLQLL